MSEITQLLHRVEEGDETSLMQVFSLLYPELRRIARARLGADDTIVTPTVLVHEALLKMTGGAAMSMVSRKHFYVCASRAMRMILVDRARQSAASKRGGGRTRVGSVEDLPDEDALDMELLDLDRALDRLKQRDQRQAQVVEMHCFGGLTFPEISALMECSERTTKRYWTRARAFLHLQVNDAG